MKTCSVEEDVRPVQDENRSTTHLRWRCSNITYLGYEIIENSSKYGVC